MSNEELSTLWRQQWPGCPPQELHNGGDSHLVSTFMEAFHHRKGQPGGGYFRINDLPDPFAQRTPPGQVVRAGRFWEDQKRSCANWGTQRRRGQI